MADPAPAITDNPTVGTPAPTEGPMIVTPNPLTNTTPPPGNNGAPAARLPTPPLPKNYSLQDIFINISSYFSTKSYYSIF